MKGKISTSPPCLIRNPYTYCFLMNVPKDLQRYVDKKIEILFKNWLPMFCKGESKEYSVPSLS
jgi:hypothetical protein